MTKRTSVIVLSLAALVACDRGASLYEKAAAAEAAGQLEQARHSYLVVHRQFPSSNMATAARAAYVRVTLELAEKALAAGERETVQTMLGQAQPMMEAAENREHFKRVQSALHQSRLTEMETQEVRALFERISYLAAAQAQAQSNIARQPSAPWSAMLLPDMKQPMQARLRLGKDGKKERKAFALEDVARIEGGKYRLAVEATTNSGGESQEWYVQNTTNGWRVLCVQNVGGQECADPWVYKTVDLK